MVLLDNDMFLSRLTLMFDKSRTKGHVALCMKRYDGRTKPHPRLVVAPKAASKKKSKKPVVELPVVTNPDEYMCLIRATCKNEKISSIVHSKDINKFQTAYCSLLKSHMDGLKRRKKVKPNKASANKE
uniref:Signal recognition particle 14 kDa protein n=2 Tax=Lepeophtheirus salmonis TaxID=72036 RepID=D3PK20_LEPSM|nr:Signal recognition particle 14 kDa protein [Lepeophtheirus salmonis]